MRQFFKFFTASCLGTIIGIGLLFGLFLLIGTRMISSMEKITSITPNSVLELTFEEAMPEKTNNIEYTPMDLSDKKYIGLYDYDKMIRHAAEDSRIKGILLRPEMASLPASEVTVIRRALKAFKESGKFVYGYGKFLTQNNYYLCSVADSVFLNPVGTMEFRGIAVDITYFKKMLDNLDIQMDVFYAGQFKSATEPFRMTGMSDANRIQLRAYIEDVFGLMLDDISTDRHVSVSDLRNMAETWKSFDPDTAVALGLLDGLIYEDQLTDRLRERTGLSADDELNKIDAQDYYKEIGSKLDFSGKDKIALVFLEGEIIIGDESGGVITDDYYQQLLADIRDDDKIKAVVLRVNSPGGSVLASENILREIRNIQRAGKPVVVSMGRYAASGGYYISCYADSIYAQPNTLTGSIGVFSMIPNLGKFLDNKIGITFDTVRTTEASTYLTGVYELGLKERQLMQKLTDDIYADFIGKVAEGRKMPIADVAEIAQGHIWTGRKALEIGLVDALGYTDDAIACASRLAKLDGYRIDEYPKMKDPIQRLIAKITGEEDMSTPMIKEQLGSMYPYYKQFKSLRNLEGTQARLPFLMKE
ncbi:MAG: signal peptide peptidase SppA [Saprospiraceae bacterium]|nr:signal peptide peptidase SppA [Saprospiraceae bacterium]